MVVIGSGRTDAGVHALGQIAHVRTRRDPDTARLLRSVNALLPDDIAVLQIERAGPAFHARYNAVSKHYRYRIYTGSVVPPFERRYVLHDPRPLNVAAMRREARALRGRHDFRAFARAGGSGRGTTRTIVSIAVRRVGSELWIDVEGSGFLHTMVRSIVGTLRDVGRGRFPSGTVQRLVRYGVRQDVGTTAPARGLTLIAVHYANDA